MGMDEGDGGGEETGVGRSGRCIYSSCLRGGVRDLREVACRFVETRGRCHGRCLRGRFAVGWRDGVGNVVPRRSRATDFAAKADEIFQSRDSLNDFAHLNYFAGVFSELLYLIC